MSNAMTRPVEWFVENAREVLLAMEKAADELIYVMTSLALRKYHSSLYFTS